MLRVTTEYGVLRSDVCCIYEYGVVRWKRYGQLLNCKRSTADRLEVRVFIGIEDRQENALGLQSEPK